jgi:hypothetical protein
MKLTPVGIDLAKNGFQVHYVDEETGEIVSWPIKRGKFLEYFANRAVSDRHGSVRWGGTTGSSV